MTISPARSPNLSRSAPDPTQPDPNRLVTLALPTFIVLLAFAAGGLHLVHNFLPMIVAPMDGGGMPPGGPTGGAFPAGGPPGGSFPAGGPPGGFPDGGPTGGAIDGLMGLVMPHLTELFILNFLAYVVLGAAFVIYRRRTSPRLIFDALLVLVSAVTLYAWNALGRPDPLGTGSMALVVELALIVLAVVDAIVVARRGALRAEANPRRA